MTSRRRNLIILAMVVALVGLSVLAIETKSTVQGIDLRGGTELVYQGRPTPKVPEITPDDMDQAIEIIRERIDTLGVSEPEISRVGADQIAVGLPDVKNANEAIKQVGKTSQLFFYDFERNVLAQNPKAQGDVRPYNRLYDAVIAAAKRKPECFHNLCTTTGPTYYLFDKDTLQLESGPAETTKDLYLRFKGKRPPGTVVKQVPQGTVVLQAEPVDDDPKTAVDESTTTARGYYVLKDRPEVSGDEIKDPKQEFDPTTNQPNVTFDFTDKGRAGFQEVTRRIAQRGAARAIGPVSAQQASDLSDTFAVVLDGEIRSRPIINFVENPDGIDGRTGAQISGNFGVTEAQDLAKFLRIGALPIKLSLISQSTVSATLGQAALDDATKAGLLGLAIVLMFLLLYYRFLGLVAGLGLLVYAVFFLAMMKAIPITLTLPGIAGMILTIGVAADSNIVIFERIKEEIRGGRSLLSAIATGYKKGIATIVDANVITLLAAFILFFLSTATVKGFAFTLGIGTIVSLFTAVLFTQAILGLLSRTRILRSPSFLGARQKEGFSWNFDFTGASKYFFSLSGVILALGAIGFATKNLNLGIDFKSGTRITVGLNKDAGSDEIRSSLSAAGIGKADNAEIQAIKNDAVGANAVQISADFTPREAAESRAALNNSFGVTTFDSTSIGPSFGKQIANKAIVAVLFSLLIISAYVALRFEGKYAVPVLIALIHDVLITGGVYALSGQEVSSATVAAFLTILGYSMYDTVIVFDRVRENVPRMPRAAFSQIVNRSMSEVLTRSLITGLSTVFLIGVLLIFGGDTLQSFAFAMMVGVASGTYSSIFIASPVLTEWKEREPAYRSRRAQLMEAMGRVPTFPEDNVVAKLGDAEQALSEKGRDPLPEPPEPEPAAGPAEPATPPQGEVPVAASPPADGDEAAARRAARAERLERRRRRAQQGGRKHGRNR